MVRSLLGTSMRLEAGAIEENKVKSRENSEDSGIEEGFKILDSENREEVKINGSLDIKDQDSTTTLEFHLTESLLNQVRTGKDNASANSGETMYKDLYRMGDVLVINNQGIDKLGVDKLYSVENTDENSNYRQFSRKVFEELFKRAGESIPVSTIIEELITSCNQAGYDGSIVVQLFPIFLQYDFELKGTSKRTIDIKYNNSDSLDINYCVNMHIAESDLPEKEYEFHAVLEFTLEAQENDVAYKDGKVTFIIPEALENHPNGKNLLNGINEHFADVDNSVIESLIGNIGEEHKSLVIDLTAEVDSDIDNSFDVIPKSLAFDELVDDTQTTTEQLGKPISPSVPPTMHVSQNNINVQPSNSTSTVTATRSSTPTTQVVPKNVPAAPVPPVTSESSGQADNVQTNGKQPTNPNNGGVTAPSVQLAAPKSIDKNSGKKDTQPKPTEVPLVASKDSERVSNVQGNSKQTSYPNKNNPTPQNARSKLPVIAASMLAITGVATGIAIAVYLEMLAVGMAVGACCLVAATIIYCCSGPSNSLEKSSAEAATNKCCLGAPN